MGGPRDDLARRIYEGLRTHGLLLDGENYVAVHSAVIAALPPYDAYRDARVRAQLASEIERIWIEAWWKTSETGATYGCLEAIRECLRIARGAII